MQRTTIASGVRRGWGLSLVLLLLVAGSARTARAEPEAPESSARLAMLELLQTLEGVQAKYLSPEYGVVTPDQVAEGERALAHILETALFFWLEADPERPVFKPYVTASRKLLGDNPDSLYYFSAIRDDRDYRISGNVGAAVFTSFTVEGGSSEGHAARRSISALDDGAMEIASDGSFEIIVSRDDPAHPNWLRLEAGAGQITTRHYHETRQSVAANSDTRVQLRIEPLGPVPLAPYGGDRAVAADLRHVANFVREHAAMSMSPPSPERTSHLGWFSLVPNQFNKPGQWKSASGDQAYGNTHAWYSAAFYELEPDEALVIEGRFPAGRFGNVVLWNPFMQSYDFANRRVSLNRKQIDFEEDGSFKIVIAHEDPGLPNWLDTEGRERGQVYWRFVYPDEEPEAARARVVKLSSLK